MCNPLKLTNILNDKKNRALNCLTVSNLKLDNIFLDVFGKSSTFITSWRIQTRLLMCHTLWMVATKHHSLKYSLLLAIPFLLSRPSSSANVSTTSNSLNPTRKLLGSKFSYSGTFLRCSSFASHRSGAWLPIR